MTPDSFDSPDGRTYSGPGTPAVTPGQAARDMDIAFAVVAADRNTLREVLRRIALGRERDPSVAADKALTESRKRGDALTARQPQPAPGGALRERLALLDIIAAIGEHDEADVKYPVELLVSIERLAELALADGEPHVCEPLTVKPAESQPAPGDEAALTTDDFYAERAERLHRTGERDAARSDLARVKRAVLGTGTHQAKIKQILAIVYPIPGDEPQPADDVKPAPELADGLLQNIDALHGLIRDILQSMPDTADEQEWRDRAGALHVCDPDSGQPYRAYTEEDL